MTCGTAELMERSTACEPLRLMTNYTATHNVANSHPSPVLLSPQSSVVKMTIYFNL